MDRPQRQWHKNHNQEHSTKISPDNKVNVNNLECNKKLELKSDYLLSREQSYPEWSNTINKDFVEYTFNEVPEHIILEWELFDFIINYTSMMYVNSKYVSFSRSEIEREYEKLFSYNTQLYQNDNKDFMYITDYTYDDDMGYVENDEHNIKKNIKNNIKKNSSFSAKFSYKQHKKKTQFVKSYGKGGLYVLLAFRNGVTYDTNKKLWYINIKPFLKSLIQEYIKDEDIYGLDFDKPWVKNLDNSKF
jgi:hypothetical protein